MDRIQLRHGEVCFPAFFPDGTRGVVRTVDSTDLANCNVTGLVMNTYHLMSKPGQDTIKNLGGLNRFIHWEKPILTDSGGFQIFSLIRENNRYGEICDNEIIFKNDSMKKKCVLTPEKCIQLQFSYGSDIMMCLDYCIHPDDPDDINRKSVDTTIRWAQKCKTEYKRQLIHKKWKDTEKPKLFGIIQGGNDKKLRKECAQALIDIGFEGFGFGGWPMDSNGNFTYDMLSYTAELIPESAVKYAMGVGNPAEIVRCFKMGYDLFDCVIPTREARHNRLYIYNKEYESVADINTDDKDFYSFTYVKDDIYWRDQRPISKVCDCHTCQNYSLAYLRHLYMIGDGLAYRLATIHNLRFYTMLMEQLRKKLGD